MIRRVTFRPSRKSIIELWWIERNLKVHKILGGTSFIKSFIQLIKDLIHPPKLGGLFG